MRGTILSPERAALRLSTIGSARNRFHGAAAISFALSGLNRMTSSTSSEGSRPRRTTRAASRLTELGPHGSLCRIPCLVAHTSPRGSPTDTSGKGGRNLRRGSRVTSPLRDRSGRQLVIWHSNRRRTSRSTIPEHCRACHTSPTCSDAFDLRCERNFHR
jgi:hypothetical protein